MLSIRLQRVGRKHEPVFRLVLTDSKNSTKSGRFLEVLGSYDSRAAEKAQINNDKVLYWVSKGAQLSDTVHNLLVGRGVVKGDKRDVLSQKPKAKVVEPPAAEEAPSTEAPATAESAEVPTDDPAQSAEAPAKPAEGEQAVV